MKLSFFLTWLLLLNTVGAQGLDFGSALDSPGLTWVPTSGTVVNWEVEAPSESSAAGAVSSTVLAGDVVSGQPGPVTISASTVGMRQFAFRWGRAPNIRFTAISDVPDAESIEINSRQAWDTEERPWSEHIVSLGPGNWTLSLSVFGTSGYSGRIDYFSPLPLPWAPKLIEPTTSTYSIAAGDFIRIVTETIPLRGLQWVAQGLPPGLTFEDGTGTVSGRTSLEGTSAIQLTGSTAGGSVTRNLQLTVTTGLAAAMDAETLTWTSTAQDSGNPYLGEILSHGWSVTEEAAGTWDGVDAVVSVPPWEEHVNRVLSVAVTGPATAQWRRKDSGGVGYFWTGLDTSYSDEGKSSDPDAQGWVLESRTIPEGDHPLYLVFQPYVGGPEYTPGQTQTLDDFRLSTEGGPMIQIKQESRRLPFGQPYTTTFLSHSPQVNAVWTATGLPAGLSIHADTGVLSGSPIASGKHHATISLTTSTGSASLPFFLEILLSYSEAVDQPAVTWTCADPAACLVDYSSSNLTLSSLPGVTAQPLTATITGPDVFTFWYTGTCQILVDGIEVLSPSDDGRRMGRLSLAPGLHTVAFLPQAGKSVTLDHFSLRSDGRPEFAIPPSVVLAAVTETISLPTLLTHGTATVFESEYLPYGLALDPVTGTVSGQGFGPVVLRATNAAGSTYAFFQVKRADPPHLGLGVAANTGISVDVPEACWVEGGQVQLWPGLSSSGTVKISIPVDGPSVVTLRSGQFSTWSGNASATVTLDSNTAPLGRIPGDSPADLWYFQIPVGSHQLHLTATGAYNYVWFRDLQQGLREPIVRGPTQLVTEVGQSVSQQFTNLGIAGTWTAENLPPGLQLDAQTGLLSGSCLRDFSTSSNLRITTASGATDNWHLSIHIRGPVHVLGSQGEGNLSNLDWSIPAFRITGKGTHQNPTHYFDEGNQPTPQTMLEVTLRGPGLIAWWSYGGLALQVDATTVATGLNNDSTRTYQTTRISPGLHQIRWIRPVGSTGATGLERVHLLGYARTHSYYHAPAMDPTLDLDGDGRNALQEYLDWSDPTVSDTPSRSYPNLEFFQLPPHAPEPTIRWSRQIMEDMEYRREGSNDLLTWTPLDAAWIGDAHRRLYYLEAPLISSGYRFYRLAGRLRW